MIIYGWREKSKWTKLINTSKCTQCGEGPVLSFTVYRYFHIYWIPLFPYSTKLWLSCQHCKAVYQADKNSTVQTDTGTKIEKERAPLYLFSGTALIIAILAVVTWSEMRDSDQYRALLLQPKVGDLIVMKLEKNEDSAKEFGVAKVLDVREKEVYLSPSNYVFKTTSSALSKESSKILLGPDGFAENVMSYERLRLLELFDTGKITAALRDEKFLALASAPKK